MMNLWRNACVGVFLTATLFIQPAAAETVTEIKPPLHGLISMGDISFRRYDNQVPNNSLKYLHAKAGALDGVVLNFTWAQLEPKRNEIDTSVIDKALEGVRAYNAQNPEKPLGVRLRVYAGPNAPDWVKRLGGNPVKVQYSAINLTIGRFWSKKYGVAWRHLQEELAKKYDADPLINEVAMTSCSSVTSEPFVFPGGSDSLEKLHRAGFTDGKYRQCLMGAPDDYIFWQKTRIEYPINPFRLSDGGVLRVDRPITKSVMKHWRKAFGANAVISNHNLQSPLPSSLRFVYDAIKDNGGIIEFQLQAPKGLDWDASIRYGTSLGATAIEIWPDTIKAASLTKLKRWSAEIKRNKPAG